VCVELSVLSLESIRNTRDIEAGGSSTSDELLAKYSITFCVLPACTILYPNFSRSTRFVCGLERFLELALARSNLQATSAGHCEEITGEAQRVREERRRLSRQDGHTGPGERIKKKVSRIRW
jgi:hypothetical protein